MTVRVLLVLAVIASPLMAQTIPAQEYAARRDSLAEGDVFTIEPGVYVSRKLLEILPDTPKNRAMIAKVRDAVARYDNTGVRIEDDYLVTTSGVEWLSRAPREIAEVEAAMARR
jgi:Xaa-Pro aminopeptidase